MKMHLERVTNRDDQSCLTMASPNAAVLCICTGRYAQFFSSLYDSCEQFFLPGVPKTYLVWTDGDGLCVGKNVRVIFQECRGFPWDSLFRFEMFRAQRETLLVHDYVYFLNVNLRVVGMVGSEVFPNEEHGHLVGCVGAKDYRWRGMPAFFDYERNKRSRAYIGPGGRDYRYFQGGFNGGRSAEYMRLVEAIAGNIEDDYARGIVARYHDESHLNRYFRDHTCKVLGPEYLWPEGRRAPFQPKIVVRDKTRVDACFRKVAPESCRRRVVRAVDMSARALAWYF